MHHFFPHCLFLHTEFPPRHIFFSLKFIFKCGVLVEPLFFYKSFCFILIFWRSISLAHFSDLTVSQSPIVWTFHWFLTFVMTFKKSVFSLILISLSMRVPFPIVPQICKLKTRLIYRCLPYQGCILLSFST